ncbi:hypothetical protein KM043_010200 [Ampulex compressa]|nr:hypothetical protein KM043_010200 [Ampulex compressa]
MEMGGRGGEKKGHRDSMEKHPRSVRNVRTGGSRVAENAFLATALRQRALRTPVKNGPPPWYPKAINAACQMSYLNAPGKDAAGLYFANFDRSNQRRIQAAY